jgi:hypothetical protein
MGCRAALPQIPLAPEHRERTSFWWRRRLMQYRRLVYGLRNATAHFQRVMDHAIRKHGLVACYVDDLLIYSHSAEEHLQHRELVFAMLRGIGIRLHPEKTLVGGKAVEFLGYMVSAQGLSPTRAKVEALLALEPPSSSGGVRAGSALHRHHHAAQPADERQVRLAAGLVGPGAAGGTERAQAPVHPDGRACAAAGPA